MTFDSIPIEFEPPAEEARVVVGLRKEYKLSIIDKFIYLFIYLFIFEILDIGARYSVNFLMHIHVIIFVPFNLQLTKTFLIRVFLTLMSNLIGRNQIL